jgi:hypothetical protein
MSRYYTYALYREDGTPFYVGKGCDKRMENHVKDARRYSQYGWRAVHLHIQDMDARGAPVRPHKIYEALTEAWALDLEAALITQIGRAPHGPLLNRQGHSQGPSDEAMRHVIRRQQHWRLRPLTRVRVSTRAANAFAALKAVFPHFADFQRGDFIWVDDRALNWLNAFRDAGEAYSDAILRLADILAKKGSLKRATKQRPKSPNLGLSGRALGQPNTPVA